MAFTTTRIKKGFVGSQRYELMSFTNADGDTGGEATFTWLKRIMWAEIQEKSAGTVAAGAVINETFPLASNAVTVITQNHSDGYIMAWGDPV